MLQLVKKAIQEESDEIGHHKVKLHLFLCRWLFNSPTQSNPPSKYIEYLLSILPMHLNSEASENHSCFFRLCVCSITGRPFPLQLLIQLPVNGIV